MWTSVSLLLQGSSGGHSQVGPDVGCAPTHLDQTPDALTTGSGSLFPQSLFAAQRLTPHLLLPTPAPSSGHFGAE